MGQLVSEVVDLLPTCSASRWLYCCRHFGMVYPRCAYWPQITNHLCNGCGPVVEVDWLSSGMVVRLYTGCDTADPDDCAYYGAPLPAAYHRRTPRSTYRGRRRAFSAKVFVGVCTQVACASWTHFSSLCI